MNWKARVWCLEKQNNDRPMVQSNGSEPTRICLHCTKENSLSYFGYRDMEKWKDWKLILL